MRTNKTKDMIRSILPSKNRETARLAKALTNRAHRRGVRIDLVLEDADETKADLTRTAFQSENVYRRRSGDKLNHFMRWCEAITHGMSTQEALDYVRAILPSSLIGDHAYGHWETHRRRQDGGSYRGDSARRRFQSFCDSTTFRLLRALALAPDLHATLNEAIKHRKQAGEPRRLLRGVHDVRAFVADIAVPAEYRYSARWGDPWPDAFGVERATTLELIKEVEQKKGGRKVAFRVFDVVTAAAAGRALRTPPES